MADKSTFGVEPEGIDRLFAMGLDESNSDETPTLTSFLGQFIEKPGTRIGCYKLLQVLGEGGFGIAYLAKQEHPIKRLVALKVVKPGMDTKQVIARFETEQQALALLDHPNIAKVFDAGATEGGRPYFAMEYVKGIPVTEYCDKYKLGIKERLRLFIPLCQAIQHAHHKGIIHRDIKPSNVLVILHDKKSIPKIIDFGVAKALNQRLTEKTLFTAQGQLIGTPVYMSPEQAELTGLDVDTRTDIYSLGVLLYELLAGCTPFDPEELRSKGYAQMQRIICEQDPVKPSTKLTTLGGKVEDIAKRHSATADQLRKSVRGDLDWIVMKCLEKDPRRRYGTAEALGIDIQHHLSNEPVLARPPSKLYRFGKLLQRNKVALQAAAVVVAVFCVVGLLIKLHLHNEARRGRALEELLPKIKEATGTRGPVLRANAYPLALKAEKLNPDHPIVVEYFERNSVKVSIMTEPNGAKAYMKNYGTPDAPWEYIGITPVKDKRLPTAVLSWKFEKEWYETVFAAALTFDKVFTTNFSIIPNNLMRVLEKEGTLPPGMVRVSVVDVTNQPHVPDFFIDIYEVTNRQFKEFVNAGGYQKQKFWKEPFVKEGVTLIWENAIKEFVDRTGQPGPATWQGGEYPVGQADYPVSGVSWYEAAAYAEFVGKSLPTSNHWGFARGYRTPFVTSWDSGVHALTGQLANFKNEGPAPVGSYQAVMPFGQYDMAGNVREWCWNETPKGRVVRGGAWNDYIYMSLSRSQALPFDRNPRNGFRCVILPDPEKVPKSCFEPLESAEFPDFEKLPQVSEPVFQVYREQFSYDKTPLDSKVEWTKQTSDWTEERITFNAAYGNEKIIGHLFLPKRGTPPYQTVIFFPGADARQRTDSTNFNFAWFFSPLIKSGRAALYPIYKGTFERNGPETRNLNPYQYKEFFIMLVKDFKRCIDYLETRSDIDRTKLAYLGTSWGGKHGAIIPAVEDRLRASVLVVGGLWDSGLPEVNQINYVRRVNVPTLMLNGKYDKALPYELVVKPMYNLLGKDRGLKEGDTKDIKVYDTDHFVPRDEFTKEANKWLDRHLGPIK